MRFPLQLLTLLCFSIAAFAQTESQVAPPSSDSKAIQQLEDDWLKAERTTDTALLDRILSDDFAGVNSQGLMPGKAQLLKNWRPHTGEAPHYAVEKSDMRIFVLGDTAVAAYVKTYTANANGNVAHEDVTDIFVRDHSAWKLRVSRSTFH